MKRKNLINTVLLNTVLLFLTAVCAVPAQGQVYTLDSCRNMAIRNNKAIRMAEENITGAGYTRKAAKAAYFPGLDFVGAYTYNSNQIELLAKDAMLPTMTFDPLTGTYIYNAVINPETGKPVMDPESGMPVPSEVSVIPKKAMEFDVHNVFVGTVTLTQPLYMGGQIRAMNEITKYAEKLAQSMRNSAVQEVVFGVDAAYWTVLSLQNKKRLADQFVNLVDTFTNNVRAMEREGVATRSDVLKTEVKLNEAQLAQTKADNALTLARMALAQLCGLPIDSRMQLDESSLTGEPQVMPMVDVNMQDVYASRPDLESIRHGIKMSEYTARAAKGDMLPKLALVGAYTFSNPNVIHGFKKQFGGGFSVGATLAIPLWHWGANYNKYRAMRSQTVVQKLALADAEEKVELQVRQARFSFQEAYKTFDMTLTNKENADENLRQAQLGFHEGVLTTEDVIAAQTAWLQAHNEVIDAEIGINLCHTYLDKVLGKLGY